MALPSQRDNPGDIVNQSVANNGNGLEVATGETITLVGGNVDLDGGKIFAGGGRVELGGLSAAGTLGLNSDGSLSFPDDVAKADVSIINGAKVDVRAGGRGSITINARNVNILGVGSIVLAGINPGLGSVGSKAGDIEINASQEVNVAVGGGVAGGIYNGTQGIGDSGNINITTGSLRVKGDGARLDTPTFGGGKAGNVNIFAQDTVTFDGTNDYLLL